MSWWFPSWLSSLPSIDFALPSGIQRRFVSFALKRSLGHFLKPGQLDIQQIDSQIGSGYVQVRDLELDNNAIKSMLAGLPLELHDGSIGKVTARIPWPNPLSSTIGLALESLHLTFNLVPTKGYESSTSEMSQSMASVAQSFIHEELSPGEEASLRESVHLDHVASSQEQEHLPGGLDPFMSDAEVSSSSGDVEPSGVSLFSSLIERFIARFAFDATDVKITIVNPQCASFTATISEFRYGTDTSTNLAGNESLGALRTTTVSGVNVTTRCLRPQSPLNLETPLQSPVSAGTASRPPSLTTVSLPTSPHAPPSPYSDSSDMDEETQMMMSQSIAFLPPRPVSPTSSVTSSMYQSAMSNTSPAVEMRMQTLHRGEGESQTTVPPDSNPSSTSTNIAPNNHRGPLVRTAEIEDEMLISFSSEPIVIRIITPSPENKAGAQGQRPLGSCHPHNASPRGSDRSTRQGSFTEKFKIDIAVGPIACALRARHVRDLLELTHSWNPRALPSPSKSSSVSTASPTSPSLLHSIELDAHLRGTVLLLLPAFNTAPTDAPVLAEFFSNPLPPPKLSHGFLRLHLEQLSVLLTTKLMQEDDEVTSGVTKHRVASKGSTPVTSVTVTLNEVSAFAYLRFPKPDTDSTSTTLYASPILFTDPNLASQYPPQPAPNRPTSKHSHPSLPVLDVTDWMSTRSPTAKLSLWRTKVAHHARHSSRFDRKVSDIGLSSSPMSVRSTPSHSASPPLKPGLATLGGSSGRAATGGPALTVKARSCSKPFTTRTGSGANASMEIEAVFEPLHAMVDLGLLFGQHGATEALTFLEEIAASEEPMQAPADIQGSIYHDQADGLETFEEDAETPPATPRQNSVFLVNNREEREQERRRLERMVLEDLDLGFDYRGDKPEKNVRQQGQGTPRRSKRAASTDLNVTVTFPMIRLQLRCPSKHTVAQRSGALIIDVHDLRISPGKEYQIERRSSTRFAAAPDSYPLGGSRHANDPLLSMSSSCIILAYAPTGEVKARTITMVSPTFLHEDSRDDSQLGLGVPEALEPLSRPTVRVIRSASSAQTAGSTTAITVDVPSVYVELSKRILDGLQFWADDITQAMERASSKPSEWKNDTEHPASRDPSLIGSKYFIRTSRHASGTTSIASDVAPKNVNETAVKVKVNTAAIKLVVPREADGHEVRPFDIEASDIDMLVELRPEGRDETVMTLTVIDILVKDNDRSGVSTNVLSLTPTHTPLSTPRAAVKLRFTSLSVPGTVVKESRIRLTLSGLTYDLYPNFGWVADLTRFAKAPPGTFESVPPSECTRVSVKLVDTSIRMVAPSHRGALVPYIGELEYSTVLVGDSAESSFHLEVPSLTLFLIDDISAVSENEESGRKARFEYGSAGLAYWKGAGYALLAELSNFALQYLQDSSSSPAGTRITVDHGTLRMHWCADTMTALTSFIGDFGSAFQPPPDPKRQVVRERSEPTRISGIADSQRGLLASLDEHAFRQLPELGALPDMINDDLPTNPDYLDESFGAAAGLRELEDDEFDEFDVDTSISHSGYASTFGGETIKIFRPEGLKIVHNHFETMTPDSADGSSSYGETILKVRIHNADVTLFLYDGYDWVRTRRIIEEQRKEMRRKLAKIRQLVASGQTPDPSVEETSTLLFNSVYIGLEHNVDELEPGALIAAIDEELNEELETASQSSWQSLKPQATHSPGKSSPHAQLRTRRKRMSRSAGPSVEFRLQGLDAEIDNYKPETELVSRTLVTVQDVEIYDHIKTSTWKKFLTSLQRDSRGNIRETDSNMLRVELRTLHPVPDHPSVEARLRAKILPLRLHVDQDALDFLKKFFSFKDPESAPVADSEPSEEIYFQQAEVFPVDIKLDYKPRRVDYRALRDGRTIELMNFFHFDGAEMTLRHITLTGITGWGRFFDLLNDLWTPDVKATQLVDVISGVSPIRSVVNVGSGVADLVLLPIAQYKKDGRVVRGLQKGTTAFVKSTAMEAIKLGARLATGTQVILEQAENVIGGQFQDPITAETIPASPFMDELAELGHDENPSDLISRYADQPVNVREGVQSAYRGLKKNLNSAAQTILAVPMEVYERSGNEGPVRAVVRAVPIAVLKPMIGASEAVSKTLLGLHNTLDPNVRHENEAKYKQR